MTDWHSTFMCERKIRKRIASYHPDVIVSVHPAMNYAPLKSVQALSKETGKHIPFFTVVTDLGSGHATWFQKNVDRIYVASERIRRLTKRRGNTPDDRIVMAGLPIRHDFAVQAEQMGDRTTPEGMAYRKEVQAQLGLPADKPMILLMGGGEGVGSLEAQVEALYKSLRRQGMDATLCVVCGRNEALKTRLAERDWRNVKLEPTTKKGKKRAKDVPMTHNLGDVSVVGLGFVTDMASYMVAADVLVSKAGPGTIAEAASVGLPVMLTSFLPGQEAGNVNYVLENEFGLFCRDSDEMAYEVAAWLRDPAVMAHMSHAAQNAGQPKAAENIVVDIGSLTHTWMTLSGKTLASGH